MFTRFHFEFYWNFVWKTVFRPYLKKPSLESNKVNCFWNRARLPFIWDGSHHFLILKVVGTPADRRVQFLVGRSVDRSIVVLDDGHPMFLWLLLTPHLIRFKNFNVITQSACKAQSCRKVQSGKWKLLTAAISHDSGDGEEDELAGMYRICTYAMLCF